MPHGSLQFLTHFIFSFWSLIGVLESTVLIGLFRRNREMSLVPGLRVRPSPGAGVPAPACPTRSLKPGFSVNAVAGAWAGVLCLPGHPECHVILFDKVCGLSVLYVLANLFFKKERKASKQASKLCSVLIIWHKFRENVKCNCIPERTKDYFPGEIFFGWGED